MKVSETNVKMNKNIILQTHNSNLQMRPTKTVTYYISPIEIGVFWAKITYVKSHSKALGFDPQTDMK